MLRITFLWLFAGLAYVSSNQCESDQASLCYADLVHYESLAFPLYGHDHVKLDDICQHINLSFECIETYAESCFGRPECDEECHDLIRDTSAFSRSTGLGQLAQELCTPLSNLRKTYLENYECLESNADQYAACHNDSQLSQEFLATIEGADMIPARCCFFSWYRDCFTNVTRAHCGENATFFVSFAMYKLIGHIEEQLCVPNPVWCERPPLPPPDDENDLDKDKPDQTSNDVDNDVQNLELNSAASNFLTLGILLLSFCLTLGTSRHGQIV